jgi:hypothetical protein
VVVWLDDIAKACTFGVIIWLDVNIDVITWLGDNSSFIIYVLWLGDNMSVVIGQGDNTVCLKHLVLSFGGM